MAERRERADEGMLVGNGAAGLHAIEAGSAAADRISAAGALVEASRVLTELLRHVAPHLHRRTMRVTRMVEDLVRALDLPEPWEFEVAARLSQIGCLALPQATLDAVVRGERLSEEDERSYASHPLLARDLLAEVRRLEDAREMIGRQREPIAVAGEPQARRPADRVTLGAQLLRVAGDLEALVEQGCSPGEALRRLQAAPAEYDERLLDATRVVLDTRGVNEPEPVAA